MKKYMQCAAVLLVLAGMIMMGPTTASAAASVHRQPNGTQWVSTWDVTADSLIQVQVVFPGNPGDFARANPDGTWFLHGESSEATVYVALFNSAGEFVKVYAGAGSIVQSWTGITEDGLLFTTDGRRTNFKVKGELCELDVSSWEPLNEVLFPFDFQDIDRNGEHILLKATFEPLGLDQ